MAWYWWVIIWMVASVPMLSGVLTLLRSRQIDATLLPGLRVWSRSSVPFMVVLDEDFATVVMQEAVMRALRFWEENVPGLWVQLGEISTGEIINIIPASKMENYPGGFGYTRITPPSGVIETASIYIDDSRLKRISHLALWRAIAHEMGHAVVLAHDPDIRMSVMYPETMHEMPALTAPDRALLKGIYNI